MLLTKRFATAAEADALIGATVRFRSSVRTRGGTVARGQEGTISGIRRSGGATVVVVVGVTGIGDVLVGNLDAIETI